MKSLLLLSLLALPAVGMAPQQPNNQKSYLKEAAIGLGLASTHTAGTVLMITKCSGIMPLTVSLGIALGSDYLLTKYAKDSK